MRPCENVIVTVNVSGFSRVYDMELPAFTPVGELCEKLLETLRLMDIGQFASVSEIGLFHAGRQLRESGTLAGYGIWDGSTVEIQTGRSKQASLRGDQR